MIKYLEKNQIQLGRSVFLVHDKCTGKKIVKLEPPVSPTNHLQKIVRFVFGGSLPFQNEVRINRILIRQKFEVLKFPTALISEDNRKIEFQYIEAVEYWPRTTSEQVRVLEALTELATLRDIHKNSTIAGFVLRKMESPVVRIFRLIFKVRMSSRNRVSATIILLRFLLKKNLGTPFLIHNDLQCRNIMKTAEGEFYFIDFEDVTITIWLQIVDFVNLLFDSDSMTINKTLLLEYWQRNFNCKVDNRKLLLYIGEQVRICLLRRALSPCTSGPRCVSDSAVSDKLLSTVIDNTAYENWWNAQ